MTIDKAVVIKAGGAEIKADIVENHLVFKSLESNDCIYIRWRIKNYYSGKLSRHFWDTFYCNGFYPVKKASYTLLAPANFRFQHECQNFTQTPKQIKSPEGMIYQWTVENEPAIRYEYEMPPLGDVGKVLHLSSIERWEVLVTWYQELIGTKTESTFEIKEQVAALMEGKADFSQDEKVKAVYEFITENIRYSNVAFRQSGFIPQKARDVLMTKIGDCKDMATLCIAMLRELGVAAHYVLAATTDEGKNEGALPAILFNHCLVAVEMENGMKFLDLTAYNYPYGALPETDLGAFALLIKSDAKAPIHVPKEGLLTNNLFRDIRVEVQNDNSIVVHSQSLRTGALTAGTRYRYRHKGTQEIEKQLIESLSTDFPDLKLQSYEFGNLDNLGPVLRGQFHFQGLNCVKDAGDFKIFSMPWHDKAEPLPGLSYERRNYPYLYADVVDTLVEKIEMRLPVGYVPVELSTAERLTCAIADYSLHLSYANGIITGERRLINKKSEVSTAEYAEFKEFWNSVMKQDDKQVLLRALPKIGAR
ncbi:MAG: transglutaminase domain-containing protein [bacterium]